MKFSSILKGLVVCSALVTLASEASAQLPVRTRELRLLGSTSGVLTQQAAATTTDYTVIWPSANATWPPVAPNTQYFLRSSTGTATTSDLSWFAVAGDLVDNFGGSAAAGQVTYWADANSITGEAGFLWDATNNTLTMGEAGTAPEIVFISGANTGTLQTATLAANVVYNLPAIPAGSYFIPAATTVPSTTEDDQILLSNTDGTAVWSTNPFAGVQRGVFDPTDGSFSAAIAVTGTPDGNDVILVTSLDVTGNTGNILAVTGLAANTITVQSSGPFTGTERVAWLWIPITP